MPSGDRRLIDRGHCDGGPGRLSHACRCLTSNGVTRDEEQAWQFLLDHHFAAPADDPAALTPAEEARYAALLEQPLDEEFTAAVQDKLRRLLPTLPSGVGAGPSGWRYEHLRAVAQAAGGMEPLLELGMHVAAGRWSPGMADARLTALMKGAVVNGGTWPCASSATCSRRTSCWPRTIWLVTSTKFSTT